MAGKEDSSALNERKTRVLQSRESDFEFLGAVSFENGEW